jgi:hypothetical protein
MGRSWFLVSVAFCGIGAMVAPAQSAPVVSAEIDVAPALYTRASRLRDLSTHQVVSDGDDEFLIWGLETGLHYMLMKNDGTRLMSVPGQIGAGTGRAAFDGTHFMVLWSDADANLWVTLINRDGTFDGPAKLVSTSAVVQDLVFDGTGYWAIAKTSQLIGIRLDQTGAIVGDGPFSIETSGNAEWARAAVGDGIVLVVMQRPAVGNAPQSIYAVRMSVGGQALDSTPVQLSAPRLDASSGKWHASLRPEVAFGAEQFLVTWLDSFVMYATVDIGKDTSRIEGTWIGAGTSLGSSQWFALTDDRAPFSGVYETEFDGTQFVVTSLDQPNWFVTLAPASTIATPPTPITPGAVSFRADPDAASANMVLAEYQRHVAAAFDGTNYLALLDDSSRGLIAARITPGGAVLDQRPISVATAAPDYGASLVYGGGEYLALWAGKSGVVGGNPDAWFGNRISPSGHALDGEGFVIETGIRQGPFFAAYQGGTFWVNIDGFNYGEGLTPVVDGVPKANVPIEDRVGSIACSPMNCLIVGQETHIWTPNSDSVVEPSLVSYPPMAAGADSYAVENDGLTMNATNLTVSILNLDGSTRATTTPFAAIDANHPSNQITMAFDGTNYAVTWLNSNEAAGEYHLFITWISPAGQILLPTPYELTPRQGSAYSSISVTGGTPGQVLVAYVLSDDDPLYDDAGHVRAILVSMVGDQHAPTPIVDAGGTDAVMDADAVVTTVAADAGSLDVTPDAGQGATTVTMDSNSGSTLPDSNPVTMAVDVGDHSANTSADTGIGPNGADSATSSNGGAASGCSCRTVPGNGRAPTGRSILALLLVAAMTLLRHRRPQSVGRQSSTTKLSAPSQGF